MKNTTIKKKFLILIFLSVLLSFAILGFYNSYNNYNSEYNLTKNKELIIAKSSESSISDYLQSKIDIVEAVAKEVTPLTLDIKNEEIVKRLRLGKIAGKFQALYLGIDENGNFLKSDGKFRTPETTDYDARKRPWYKVEKATVSEPYVDYTTKKLVISVSAPIRKDGKIIGVIGSDIFIDTIVDTILNINLNNIGFAYLLDNAGKIIVHKDKKQINKQSKVYDQIKSDKSLRFAEANDNGNKQMVVYNTIPITNWKLIIQLDKSAIVEEINKHLVTQILLYLILLTVILVILYLALVKILAPLKTLESGLNFFFKYLKSEEKHINKLEIKTNDEFGNMSKIINQEMESVAKSIEQDNELIENVKYVVSHVNQGRLDVKVEKSTATKSLNELKDSLNHMIETIKNNVNKDINPILSQLEEYAKLNFVKNIPDANGNIAKGLNNLSDIINEMLQENQANGLTLDDSSKILLKNVDTLNTASNQTAASLEETAAALEEITSTVIANTERIATMAGHSKELSSSIEEGHNLANTTVDSMNSINEQTQAIADAIIVIDQIAFQTNILSLNAAVEAATAGEAGKGFAVVAAEVRNLASRSAEAAKEIKSLVENATDKTNSGKKIADDMIHGYTKLKENLSQTTGLIKDISDSSKEQRTGIEQINDVVNRLDVQTQENASVATQTHDIALKASDIASKILETVNQKEFRNK